MKEFFKRNSPIFIIGGLTTTVFLTIIVTSNRTPQPPETKLVKIASDQLVATHTYTQGPEEAPVTLVEFSDFECPACKNMQGWIKTIRAEFPDDVKIAFRHFPLPQHKSADEAATAAQIAGEYGKFWEYVDLLFANQANFKQDELIGYAAQLNIDPDSFKKDLKSKSFDGLVKEDVKYGLQLKLKATPTFFMNGVQMEFENYDEFRQLIVDELARLNPPEKESDQNAPVGIPSKPDPYLESELFDAQVPPVEISFSAEGFDPREVQVWQGQLVKWTNNTTTDMKIQQLIEKFEEFEEGVTIKPGETYSFRTRAERLWTYKELNTDSWGSIYIRTIKR